MRCENKIFELKKTLSNYWLPAAVLKRWFSVFFKTRVPKIRGAKRNSFTFFAENAVFLFENGGPNPPIVYES